MSLDWDQLHHLKDTVKFRDSEFDLLNSFIDKEPECCVPTLFVHGFKAVGKTLAVRQFLQHAKINHSYIECDSILQTGVLLQRCLQLIREDSGLSKERLPPYYHYGNAFDELVGCDTFSRFIFNLEALVHEGGYSDTHVLVLDRIDQFTEDSFGVMKAFERMRDVADLPNICVVLISRSEPPSPLVTSCMPQIYFKSYTESQIVEIFRVNQFCFFDDPELDRSPAGKQFWNSFVQVMVDSYYEYCGSNLTLLIELSVQKWDGFIERVRNGEFGPTEFLKVYRENRAMLQEDAVTSSTVVDFHTGEIERAKSSNSLEELTHMSKFILIASFLASIISPKDDVDIFTKSTFGKHVPYRRKAAQLTKKDLDPKLLQPAFFDLERLFAILLVLYRNESQSLNKDLESSAKGVTEEYLRKKQHDIAKFTIASNVDLQNQLATLLSQGLIHRQATRDILQPRSRWRCAVSFEIIEAIAKDVQFPLHSYLP